MAENAIITRVFDSPLDIDASAWNALLAAQPHATPFMRHEYLAALHASGSATPRTGWAPRFITLWQAGALVAACPLYAKSHSYGEYVFDWAWAHAYEQHGLHYYPKAVVAVPFTPVPGTRLMARDAATRQALLQAVRGWCEEQGLSSLHVLFADDGDMAACTAGGLMPRHTVQFHWTNHGYRSFDEFLAQLAQDKRKKIRQERRRVAEAGVTFRCARGADIAAADWDFFYRCYERTYLEHGNPPYLTRDFFARMQRDMAGHWLLFIAERAGRPIASSLIAISADPESATGQKDHRTARAGRLRPLLGRARARGLPALRSLLLPAAAVVHRARRAALRGRRPGRAQDGARAAARAGAQRALARAPGLCRRGGPLPGARRRGRGAVPGPPAGTQPVSPALSGHLPGDSFPRPETGAALPPRLRTLPDIHGDGTVTRKALPGN